MEMHTRRSLRRVHDIDVRKAIRRRRAHELTYSECLAIAAEERGEAYRAAVSWLKAHIVEPIRRERRYRRDMHALMCLSDALLEDIGISRGDIEYSVRHGRPERS